MAYGPEAALPIVDARSPDDPSMRGYHLLPKRTGATLPRAARSRRRGERGIHPSGHPDQETSGNASYCSTGLPPSSTPTTSTTPRPSRSTPSRLGRACRRPARRTRVTRRRSGAYARIPAGATTIADRAGVVGRDPTTRSSAGITTVSPAADRDHRHRRSRRWHRHRAPSRPAVRRSHAFGPARGSGSCRPRQTGWFRAALRRANARVIMVAAGVNRASGLSVPDHGPDGPRGH